MEVSAILSAQTKTDTFIVQFLCGFGCLKHHCFMSLLPLEQDVEIESLKISDCNITSPQFWGEKEDEKWHMQ